MVERILYKDELVCLIPTMRPNMSKYGYFRNLGTSIILSRLRYVAMGHWNITSLLKEIEDCGTFSQNSV